MQDLKNESIVSAILSELRDGKEIYELNTMDTIARIDRMKGVHLVQIAHMKPNKYGEIKLACVAVYMGSELVKTARAILALLELRACRKYGTAVRNVDTEVVLFCNAATKREEFGSDDKRFVIEYSKSITLISSEYANGTTNPQKPTISVMRCLIGE